MLWLNGVALAPENFNTAPPFVTGARKPFLDDNGHVFLQGFTWGLEWMW